MELKLTIPAEILVPDLETAASVAAFAMEECVRNHLRAKNDTTTPRAGFTKTNYYAKAANDVTGTSSGAVATVTVGGVPGIALHYYGGTVLPLAGHKSLAIPVSPSVADIWPSEYTGMGHRLFKTPAGALGDAETGEILWVLVPRATIHADPTVLPSDDAMLGAAAEAIWEAAS